LVGCRWRPTPILEFSAKNAAWLLTKGAIVLKFVLRLPRMECSVPVRHERGGHRLMSEIPKIGRAFGQASTFAAKGG
jgi:hypothetical protein